MVKFIRMGAFALIIWLITGAITWATYAPPEATKLVSAAKRSNLIDLKEPSNLKADIDTLSSTDFGGAATLQAQAAAAAPVQTERWVRIAVVTETGGTYLLLQSPAGEAKSYRAGDTLPDGSKLIKASAAEIVTRPARGKAQTFRLMD